jgi:hypothetical protein
MWNYLHGNSGKKAGGAADVAWRRCLLQCLHHNRVMRKYAVLLRAGT